jgi:predicted  nucleic acid-binding Zn-ribbon protein
MATGLEAIAEKLEQERQNKLESILSISGSQAIAKNDYGITVVEESNVASSLVFKELNKNKYDNVELLKAVDVVVKELKPDIPTANLNLVPKPLYDEKVVENEDLRKQVTDLTAKVTELNTQVSDLKTQVQTEVNSRLTIEQTNDALVNQLQTLTQTIDEFALQIQVAVQKSVDESILRTSLQAQNTGFKAQIEALIKQIDSLNSIIEGLQSQLGAVQNQQAIVQGTQAQAQAAGADVVNEVAIVKVKTKADANQPAIYGKINAKGGNKFINGTGASVTNNDKQPIQVSIQISNPSGIGWLTASQTSFSVAPGASTDVDFKINEGAAGNVDSKKGKLSYSHSADYEGGNVKIVITRSDGSSKDRSYPTKLTKNHPDSF